MRMRLCRVHANYMSCFFLLFTKVFNRIGVGGESDVRHDCLGLGRLGALSQRCTVLRVMCACLMFSVRQSVWIRGELISFACICAAGLVCSTVSSLAWREACSIACCSFAGRIPQSVLSMMCRMGPVVSPMHSARDSSSAFWTLCI